MADEFWDSNLKQLITTFPQDFASWLMEGATVEGALSGEFKRTRYADFLYGVTHNGVLEGIHVEIQLHSDAKMDERVLEYNVLATRKYGRTFTSYVLYLQKGGKIPPAPYIRTRSDGTEIHHFHFVNIELWEIPAEHLKQMGLIGLLPLLPLTLEGATRTVIDEAIAEVQQVTDEEKHTLLVRITLAAATIVFKDASAEDKEWLKKVIAMHDKEFQDTVLYEVFVGKGIQQGEQKERERGLKQQLQDLREVVLDVLQDHSSSTLSLAKTTLAGITDKEVLKALIPKIYRAQTEQEVQQILMLAANKASA